VTWLRQTHSVGFELVRHFLRRMFDGDWSSSPGQWTSAATSLFALLLPAGLLLIREGALDPKYASRYSLMSRAAGSAGIRAAVIADELALITLLFCVTGLIALLQWQSLFPSHRDYLALASLPVRPRQVFLARFVTVLLFSGVMIGSLNLLPSLIAAIEFGGAWRLDSTFFRHASVQAAASGLACFFVFFAVVAIQGLLLNLLPPRLFGRIAPYVQGLLAGVFLLAGFYSWSIKQWPLDTIGKLPAFGEWLPPVWYTGVRQTLLGDTDPFFVSMRQRAFVAAALALFLTVITYLISYRRYRKLLLEAAGIPEASGLWRCNLLRLLAGSPRREAVIDFMAKTLTRSRTHRLLWMVYIGAAAAVVLNSSLIDGALFAHSKGWGKALQFLVLFWPLACSVVILNGFRHVLSVPSELRANWIFQLTESQGRVEWMSAVERFVIAYAIAPIYLILFPVAGGILGWGMAVRMTTQQILISLIMFELLFYSWQKLPFTCSYQPGNQPLVAIIAKYIAILGALVPILSVMVAVAAEVWWLFPVYGLNFAAIWIWARCLRREGWGETKLLYQDEQTAVTNLGIKELTYTGTAAHIQRNAV